MASNDDKEVRPNFFERTLATVAPTYALGRAIARDKLTYFGYDAATPGTKRGSSGGAQKNAASESARMNRDRIAMMWDARDLERQMPVISCGLDRYPQYVFPELSYHPGTGEPEIDSIYKAYFQDWCEFHADITGRHDLHMLAQLAVRSHKRDGDTGFVVVTEDVEFPALQAIESDRIGNPQNATTAANKENYAHGIKLDRLGRPVGFEVYNRTNMASYKLDSEVEADRFIHIFKPMRFDQYRGVTWFAPVLAQCRDLYEMFAFERGAAKWAASYAGVIRYAGARMPGGGASDPTGWDGVSRTEQGSEAVKVEANKLLRLRPGEDVTPFNSGARPSGAFMAYIEAALRDIAMGLNVPYGFFNMASFNGTVSRIEIQQCQRTFRAEQRLMVAKFFNPIRDIVLADGIAKRLIPAHRKWRSGRWQFGKTITADVGYQSQADIAMMQMGLKTGTSIVADEGEDFEEVTESNAKEAATIYKAALRHNVPMELITTTRYINPTELLATANAAAEPETPAPPTLETIGDKGAGQLTDVMAQVARGELPRAQAVAMLINVWSMDPNVAEQIVPLQGSVTAAPPTNRTF